ncbi:MULTISPECIES: TetR/AcrR family transcriptional regulator [unclassified Streptomyces]|uniref:TetR/AcrR family transcriptional regulator n=1 Tax=unclassified Streptomyces TaxID=2593676 RepID=UPI00382490CC
MAAGAKQPTGRYGGRTAGERRAERRQRLLDAGLHLFGGGPGYRATSVSALCEEAGLSTRQFYEEFSNLEEVLAALHTLINKWAEEAAMSALATMPEGGVEERAAAAFRAYASCATCDPRRIRIAFVEVVGVSPQLEAQRLARRGRWAEVMLHELKRAAVRGEAAERDYRVAATAFIGAVNGLLHDWTAGAIDASLDEIVDELLLMLIGVLRPKGWRAS